jgi:hypothetical protein
VTDPFFEHAMAIRAGARAAFDDYKAAVYAEALEATRGAMLNDRGRRAGVDAFDLFEGNRATAHAYASPELVEWWSQHGRPVFAAFSAQWPMFP